MKISRYASCACKQRHFLLRYEEKVPRNLIFSRVNVTPAPSKPHNLHNAKISFHIIFDNLTQSSSINMVLLKV